MKLLLLTVVAALAADPPATEAPAAYGLLGVDWACAGCTGVLSEHLASVTASSSLKGNYAPSNAVDGKAETAWCEGAEGPGVGSWLEIRFKAPVHLDAVQLWGGYFKSAELLAANGRPNTVTITLDGGRSFTRTVVDPTVLGRDDIRGVAITDPKLWFERARQAPPILGVPDSFADAKDLKLTSSVRITIDTIGGGKKYSDTCISEIGLIFADPKDME